MSKRKKKVVDTLDRAPTLPEGHRAPTTKERKIHRPPVEVVKTGTMKNVIAVTTYYDGFRRFRRGETVPEVTVRLDKHDKPIMPRWATDAVGWRALQEQEEKEKRKTQRQVQGRVTGVGDL